MSDNQNPFADSNEPKQTTENPFATDENPTPQDPAAQPAQQQSMPQEQMIPEAPQQPATPPQPAQPAQQYDELPHPPSADEQYGSGSHGSNVPYAKGWRRFLAIILDALIMGAAMAVVGLTLFIVGGIAAGGKLSSNVGENGFAGIVVLALIVLALITISLMYYGKSVQSKWQATPGKRIMKIFLARTDGKRLSFWFGMYRSTMMYAPWAVLGYLLWFVGIEPYSEGMDPAGSMYLYGSIISLLMIAFTKQKAAVHDYICSTRVLSGKAEEVLPDVIAQKPYRHIGYGSAYWGSIVLLAILGGTVGFIEAKNVFEQVSQDLQQQQGGGDLSGMIMQQAQPQGSEELPTYAPPPPSSFEMEPSDATPAAPTQAQPTSNPRAFKATFDVNRVFGESGWAKLEDTSPIGAELALTCNWIALEVSNKTSVIELPAGVYENVMPQIKSRVESYAARANVYERQQVQLYSTKKAALIESVKQWVVSTAKSKGYISPRAIISECSTQAQDVLNEIEKDRLEYIPKINHGRWNMSQTVY